MIDYNKIINTVRERVPEFTIDEIYKDLPTVIFSFLSIFIQKAYETKNRNIIEKCIGLMNYISEIDDPDVLSLIDEISIGLYDHSHELYEEFKSRLSDEASRKFENSISHWKKQGK